MADASQDEPLARAFAQTIRAHFGDGEMVDVAEIVIASLGAASIYINAVEDPSLRVHLRSRAIATLIGLTEPRTLQ